MAREGQARGLRLAADLLAEYLAVGDESLHNSISGKFRWFTPTPREALLTMHEQSGAATGNATDVLYFHKTVSRYLNDHGGAVDRRWPKKAGAAKLDIDNHALQMYIFNRLRGHEPKGEA
jgi:hypothetical protein